MTDDATNPTTPGVGRRLRRALLLLVMYPVAGIPVLVGIAAETAVIAWVLDGLGWFGAPGFGPIFAWLFGVQAGLSGDNALGEAADNWAHGIPDGDANRVQAAKRAIGELCT